MRSALSKNSSAQIVILTTIAIMLLNVFIPLNFTLTAEATEHPFKLAISLEKTTFMLGERINVSWTLSNIGTETVTIYNSRDDAPDFLIRDENLNYVFRYRQYLGTYAIIYPIAQIAPGNNITLMGMWKQIYDGSGKGGVSFERVPPGVYYVSGFFKSATYSVEFETPPIRIIIT